MADSTDVPRRRVATSSATRAVKSAAPKKSAAKTSGKAVTGSATKTKKTPAKTAPAKKAAAKKAPAKTAAAKKGAAKKGAAKKTPTKAAGSQSVPRPPRPPEGGGATSAGKKKSLSAAKSKFFRAALKKAEKLKGKEGDLLSLADAADKRARKLNAGAGSKVIEELKALLRLMRAYAKKDYREVSWDSMALIVAGIIYVVNPIDLIPDAIPGLGFLDDAAVLGFVLQTVRGELDEFLEWETANKH